MLVAVHLHRNILEFSVLLVLFPPLLIFVINTAKKKKKKQRNKTKCPMAKSSFARKFQKCTFFFVFFTRLIGTTVSDSSHRKKRHLKSRCQVKKCIKIVFCSFFLCLTYSLGIKSLRCFMFQSGFIYLFFIFL